MLTTAQQLGWTRVGHALAVVAGPVGRAVWAGVKAGWPFLLALVILLLAVVRRRVRPDGAVRAAGRNMAARRWLAVTAGGITVAGLLAVVLVTAPPWFVRDRSLEGLKAQNEVRTTLLQGLGGVVLLVGAYFTYRQVASIVVKPEVMILAARETGDPSPLVQPRYTGGRRRGWTGPGGAHVGGAVRAGGDEARHARPSMTATMRGIYS